MHKEIYSASLFPLLSAYVYSSKDFSSLISKNALFPSYPGILFDTPWGKHSK